MSNTSNNNYNSKLVIAVITIAIFTRLFEAIPLISIWRIPVKGEEEHNIGVPSSTDFLLVMQKEESTNLLLQMSSKKQNEYWEEK